MPINISRRKGQLQLYNQLNYLITSHLSLALITRQQVTEFYLQHIELKLMCHVEKIKLFMFLLYIPIRSWFDNNQWSMGRQARYDPAYKTCVNRVLRQRIWSRNLLQFRCTLSQVPPTFKGLYHDRENLTKYQYYIIFFLRRRINIEQLS